MHRRKIEYFFVSTLEKELLNLEKVNHLQNLDLEIICSTWHKGLYRKNLIIRFMLQISDSLCPLFECDINSNHLPRGFICR